jgi:hypothetical protein
MDSLQPVSFGLRGESFHEATGGVGVFRIEFPRISDISPKLDHLRLYL